MPDVFDLIAKLSFTSLIFVVLAVSVMYVAIQIYRGYREVIDAPNRPRTPGGALVCTNGRCACVNPSQASFCRRCGWTLVPPLGSSADA